MDELSQLLDRIFCELYPLVVTHAQRAVFLGVDTGTYSKIINRKQSLTDSRAAQWAERLYPSDPVMQDQFIAQVTIAGQRRTATVEEFCQAMVDNGGWLHAVRISELFDALLAEAGESQLICCEYRDLPRASEAAKYEAVGKYLALAIARGLNFAMFQPFVGQTLKTTDFTELSEADIYMQRMLTECRKAHRRFLLEAKSAARKMGMPEGPIENRLRLYERNLKAPLPGSGFQAKMFYIYYRSKQSIENHYRIIQWVATPKQDLLVYRAQQEIDPKALRDSFYPVPHYFEEKGHLPPLAEKSDIERLLKEIHGTSPDRRKESIPWTSYPREGE